MKYDSTAKPGTLVSFAIVMLGTAVERYALPDLLSLRASVTPLCCSMKIISTIGYVVVGLTIAVVDGDCMS